VKGIGIRERQSAWGRGHGGPAIVVLFSLFGARSKSSGGVYPRLIERWFKGYGVQRFRVLSGLWLEKQPD